MQYSYKLTLKDSSRFEDTVVSCVHRYNTANEAASAMKESMNGFKDEFGVDTIPELVILMPEEKQVERKEAA